MNILGLIEDFVRHHPGKIVLAALALGFARFVSRLDYSLACTSGLVHDHAQHCAAEARSPESVRMMGDFLRPKVMTVVMVVLLLVIFASVASAQPPSVPEQPLIIEGRVLWIDFGGQTMALAPDNRPAVTIDLHQIPQGHYQGFRGNEYVRIVGFILRPSRRIQASALYLVSPWYPTEPP